MKLHPETVPHLTQTVLTKISNIPDLENFYLSGGTALSLQLGHRESEDLDFFIKTIFEPQKLQEKLLQYGALENVMIDTGTLNTFMDKVKLQFLHYPYSLLEEMLPWNGINISSVIDIACTKLITISMRGSKKDFIDLYVILQQMELKNLFTNLEKKYKKVQYNYPHILKSLIYFEDADVQPMPKMHIALELEEVKNTIVEQVKGYKF